MDSIELDAPLYLPAVAFELPEPVSFKPRLAEVMIAELRAMRGVWPIVLKHFPVMAQVIERPLAKPNLHLITLQLVNAFKPFATEEQLAALEAELQRLPQFMIVAPRGATR